MQLSFCLAMGSTRAKARGRDGCKTVKEQRRRVAVTAAGDGRGDVERCHCSGTRWSGADGGRFTLSAGSGRGNEGRCYVDVLDGQSSAVG